MTRINPDIIINPDSMEGAAIITIFIRIKELELMVSGLLGLFPDVGIDPDWDDWGFPDEEPRCVAQRFRESYADAGLAFDGASHVGFDRFCFGPSLNLDSPEGETLNTLCDGIKELELRAASLLRWFHAVGVHPDKESHSMTQRS